MKASVKASLVRNAAKRLTDKVGTDEDIRNRREW